MTSRERETDRTERVSDQLHNRPTGLVLFEERRGFLANIGFPK
jgi:hypothetical protein